jgi:esterase/lipase superfamily enzyme
LDSFRVQWLFIFLPDNLNQLDGILYFPSLYSIINRIIENHLELFMHEQYHKWYTQYLSRDFEMLVFGHSGYPVILFPTLMGRYYESKDTGLIESISHLVGEGKIKIYCPDGIDNQSWHNYNIQPSDRVKTHIAYENVILNDVIEFAKYESGEKKVCVCGCSFGGYHALNLAFRHPDKIDSLISVGGTFDIRRFIMGHFDDDCYFNNPPEYMPNLNDEWFLERIKKIEIILGTGEWDINLEENKQMSGVLTSKNIPHQLDIRSFATHDWKWWKEMLPVYLTSIIQSKKS